METKKPKGVCSEPGCLLDVRPMHEKCLVHGDPKELTREEFLDLVTKEFTSSWRARRPEYWWLALERFARLHYNRSIKNG